MPFGTVGEEVVVDITPEPMATAGIGTATLIRSVIRLMYGTDSVSTSSAWQQVAFGITVMTNDAFAGLVVPDPLTGDFQQSWYYWTCLMHRSQSSGSPQGVVQDVDIHSARRLRGGFKLVGIGESLAANDIDTTLFVTMRNLWQITS